MYVRRCPRISASSRTPPREIRTNFRFMERAIDWPSDVLPTPGGPTKQRIGPFIVATVTVGAAAGASLPTCGRRARRRAAVLTQLLHREVLDDALFDLVEVVVVLVQDATGFDRVEAVFARLVPRDVEQPVQIRADHLVFGRGGRHALEAFDFAHARSSRSRSGSLASTTRARSSWFSVVALAELGLDRLHLLAQQVLPLRVGHLLLGARLDLALELEHFDFARQRHRDRRQLDGDAVLLEQLLLVLGLHVEQAGEQVGEAQRIVEAGDERLDVWREPGGERERAIDELLQAPHVRVDLNRAFRRFRQRRQLAPASRRCRWSCCRRGRGRCLRPAPACRSGPSPSAGGSRRCRRGADRPGAGSSASLLLEQQQDHAVAGERAVDGFDGHRTADAERRHRHRQHDRAADRDDGELGWERRGLRRVRHRLRHRTSDRGRTADARGGRVRPPSPRTRVQCSL